MKYKYKNQNYVSIYNVKKNNKITCNPHDCRTISTIDRARVNRRIHIVFLIAIGMKLRRW